MTAEDSESQNNQQTSASTVFTKEMLLDAMKKLSESEDKALKRHAETLRVWQQWRQRVPDSIRGTNPFMVLSTWMTTRYIGHPKELERLTTRLKDEYVKHNVALTVENGWIFND